MKEHVRIAASVCFLLTFNLHTFFISNTFISSTKVKLADIQARTKQHPETELLFFENYSLSSYMLPSKNNRRYSKKCAKNKCVCFNEITWLWLTVMKMRLKMKSRPNRYDLNRPRRRHGPKYTKYKMCLSMMKIMCIKSTSTDI